MLFGQRTAFDVTKMWTSTSAAGAVLVSRCLATGQDYRRGRLASPSSPGNGDTMGFTFALISTDGEVFDSFE